MTELRTYRSLAHRTEPTASFSSKEFRALT
ncbi:hypothetical protein Hsar01_02340 [Haloferula sargassicola]|uniref:Uncharacterized protein n=1 Tax=Haloferula sargassicola TaxID=490096 RepID=A0ABP9UQZ9_9BACT